MKKITNPLSLSQIGFLLIGLSLSNVMYLDFFKHQEWSELCVKNQLVYTYSTTGHSLAVNALDDDGKPVNCEINSN